MWAMNMVHIGKLRLQNNPPLCALRVPSKHRHATISTGGMQAWCSHTSQTARVCLALDYPAQREGLAVYGKL